MKKKKGFTLPNFSKKNLGGFTLIELIIAIALIFMIAGLTLPVGFNFFQESTLKDQARNLENSLRKAQSMAMTGRGDSNAGVRITQSEYTIFEGESYEKRREEVDTAIPFPIALSVSSADEEDEIKIVFQKLSGLPIFPEPEEEKLITLKFGDFFVEITVNSQGKIERGRVEKYEAAE
jgi:type II secretory pathway pseudopilin PulG